MRRLMLLALLAACAGLSRPAWAIDADFSIPTARSLSVPSAAPSLPDFVVPAPPQAAPQAAMPPDESASELALPAPSQDTPDVARLREHVASDLAKMAFESGRIDNPLLPQIYETANSLLDGIDARLRAGEIDPSVDLRTSESDPVKPTVDKTVRVGFYPIAGDPITWGHVLVGLQAIDRLKLDKIVFVFAGDDPRKPQMTKADVRHPIGQAVIDAFAPFFAYSSLAVGTTLDGETNLFRFLNLNPDQSLKAYYMVGDDHYRRLDKKGNPDTIAKIEEKLAEHLRGFAGAAHDVSLAFTQREGVTQPVETPLNVQLLPHIPFEASSTMVRNGHHILMPHTAYSKAKDVGLYNLTKGVRP